MGTAHIHTSTYDDGTVHTTLKSAGKHLERKKNFKGVEKQAGKNDEDERNGNRNRVPRVREREQRSKSSPKESNQLFSLPLSHHKREEAMPGIL